MAGLSADGLLTLIERGARVDKLTRLRLLAEACGEDAAVDGMHLGEIDRRIWRLFKQVIAPRTSIGIVCSCPACPAELEFTEGEAFDVCAGIPVSPAEVLHDGRSFTLRQPCLMDIQPNGLDMTALSPDAPWEDEGFQEQAEEALAAADPMLDIGIALSCSGCGHAFRHSLDLAALFWEELLQQSRALIRDVLTLSEQLGWSEQAILAMSPARRGLYLGELNR